MLTTISKCLAVFTVVASLTFLGVAVIATASGPNWAGELDELPQFTFTKTVSETGTTWGVKSRVDEDFSKNGILPEVIVAARSRLKQDQEAELGELRRQTDAVSVRLKQYKEWIATDLKAVDARVAQLKTDLTDINQQIIDKTTEGTKLAEETSQVQVDTETRRQEVIRLQAQLKEIRADKFRADEQKKRLVDLLARVTGNIDRVDRRNRQLRKRLDKPPKAPY